VPEDGVAGQRRLLSSAGRVQICALRNKRRQVVVARVIEVLFQMISPSVHGLSYHQSLARLDLSGNEIGAEGATQYTL
jgi:hypothetical protein